MTETFNDRLEKLLKERNLQKKDLADAIGISANGISTWKATGTIPRADIAIKIARYLNVSVEFLVLGETGTTKDELAYIVAGLSEKKQKVIHAVIELLESAV